MVTVGGVNPFGYLIDVWALSLEGPPAWSVLVPTVNPPTGRGGHTAIYDPVRDRMVVFGGKASSGGFLNDVWVLSLSGSPAWSALVPVGSPPSARYGHTAIYDPVGDRIIVFGGSFTFGAYNDVWVLSLSGSPAWSALVPAGSLPSGRYGHAAIYDPVRDRMVVFGGYDGTFRDDVWALSLDASPAWSVLATSGGLPSARYGHGAIYDPVRDRMMVFGGYDGNFDDDVWALSLAASPAWSLLTPAGGPPPPRLFHSAVYDPVRDRMVIFGGDGYGGRQPDVWALSLAATAAWNALTPAGNLVPARWWHSAIHDPVRDRMIVFGGAEFYPNDLWALAWPSPVSVPGDGNALRRRFALSLPRPNPSRGETLLDVELGEIARVILDVFDARGRRVRLIADGWLDAGRHVCTWRGDDEGGHALGSGVYFIRMRADGFEATRRAVLVR